MNRIKSYLIFILGSLLFLGCAAQNTVQIVEPQKIYNTYKKIEDKPKELHDLYVSYHIDERRNSVLNLMQLGLYAFQKGYYKDAELAFDKVLLHIESTYSENEESKKAISLWYGEDSKRFIGEPYERSMAYLYRGLLYLKDKDYENARASFKGGLLQDARSEDSQHQSDFKILLLLEALSSKLNRENGLYFDSLNELSKTLGINPLNETTEDSSIEKSEIGIYMILSNSLTIRNTPSSKAKKNGKYKKNQLIEVLNTKKDWSETKDGWVFNKFIKLAKIKPKVILTNKNLIEQINKSNFFLIIESGNSPEKYTSGEYDAELNFKENGYLIKPKIMIGDRDDSDKLIELDNLYFQASTRGGREIDKVIDGKVDYKDEMVVTALESNKVATSSFQATSSILSNHRSTGNAEYDAAVGLVALTIGTIGLIAKGVSVVSEEISEAIVTKADARYWNNLPGGIYVYMDNLKPGKYKIDLQAETTNAIEIEIPEDNEIVIEHVFDKITKPNGIVNMYQIDSVIEEKDKYQNKYIEDKEGEESNEKLKENIINFFTIK